MRTAQGSTPLLWTGGWDSTFRLLQLLLVERRSVQPYYVIEGARRASSAEQTAMRNIRELLRTSHPEASARLQETIEVPLDQIAADAHIFSNYENALHFAFIGGQYEWLARRCAQRGVTDMELAIHRDDKGVRSCWRNSSMPPADNSTPASEATRAMSCSDTSDSRCSI